MDANNTEQPQLAFQRKAVEAFHSHCAQEAEAISLGNPPIQAIPASSSNNAAPITLSPKRNLSESTFTDKDKDTDSDLHVEDENSDNQPKSCKSLAFTPQIVN